MAFEDNVFTYMGKRKAMAEIFQETRDAMEQYVKEINAFMKKVEEARAISDFFINNPDYSLQKLISREASERFKNKVISIEQGEQTKVKALEKFYQLVTDEINSATFNGYKLDNNYKGFFPYIMASFCKKNRLPEDQVSIWQSSYNDLYISNKLKDDLYDFLDNSFYDLDQIIVSDEKMHNPQVTINSVISGILVTLRNSDDIVKIDDSPEGLISKKIEEAKDFLPNSFNSVKKELLDEYKKHLDEMSSSDRKEKAISISVTLRDKVDDLKIPIGIN